MQLREKPIASPLNYTGGKYKLLPQIFPLFPDNINTFVDIFCGGCNVGINVNAQHIICNDNNTKLIGLFNHFKNTNYQLFLNQVNQIIDNFNLSRSSDNGYACYGCDSANGLGSYNRTGFLALRENFNSSSEIDNLYYAKLYVLIVYAFNNQIRFNVEGKYNLPVGKRDFNKRMSNKLERFISNIGNIDFSCVNFSDFDIDNFGSNDFFYADPPYLITCATYNELNGWNEIQEHTLLQFLDKLHNQKVKFALSNVLSSKGNVNTILESWLNLHPNYICHHLNFSYKNSNYHKKEKNDQVDEVLITNY